LIFNPLLSFFRTLLLAIAGRIHFPTGRIGETVDTENGHNFRVFRQVIIDPAGNQPAVPGAIFHVHFRITSMTARQNKLFSLMPIPFIIGLPGFRSKLWIADDATGDCQGIYQWDSIAHAEKYAASVAMRFMMARAVKGSVWYRISAPKKAEGACYQAPPTVGGEPQSVMPSES
jgi:hypothetical protein